jgi:hypothetical protein
MKIKMKFYTVINEKGCVETCCYLDIGDGFEYFGTSKQNPLDKHNEHIGNRTALIELLTGESNSFTRNTRLKIWQHFHEHYKPESERLPSTPLFRHAEKRIGKDLDLRLRKIATHTTNITNAIKEIDRLMGGGDENYLRND